MVEYVDQLSIDEVKELAVWARNNGVKRIKMNNVELELTELAFVGALETSPGQPTIRASEELDTDRTLLDEKPENADKDDDMLFWSSGQ